VTALRDFVYAARMLRRSPAFAGTSIATIALAIGAATSIFCVANAVLVRPLPYGEPGGLVFACADLKTRNLTDFLFSNADFFDLRSGATSALDGVAAVTTGRTPFPRDDGTPEQISYAMVTPDFFRLLGVSIAFGRDFVEADGAPQPPRTGAQGEPPPAPTLAILSHEFFQRRYGGNASALGTPMLGGKGPIIVGVLAPGFELFFPSRFKMERTPDAFFASRLPYDAARRINVSLRLIGRLKKGAALEQAQAAANSVAAHSREVEPIWRTSGYQIRLEPMHRYLVAEARPAILALTGAAVFLLLIACANVANLFLVRASLRGRELAVRMALGAGRWNLTWQMMAEALLLAMSGSVAGFALAWLGIRTLARIAPSNLPRLNTITADPMLFAFSIGAGLVAAALFGALPALRTSRPDFAQALRASGQPAGLARGAFFRGTVVMAEVALSFVLLVGSGLMFRSFLALIRINPGFEPRGILTVQMIGGRPARTPAERAAAMRERRGRLAAIPGVTSVTAASALPLADEFVANRWGREDALTDGSKYQSANLQVVLPGYFETMRIPLLAGRTFTEADNTPESTSVVIDQVLAEKAFPSESAVGKRILLKTYRKPNAEWVEVIGVVTHQRENSLTDPGREEVFVTNGFLAHELDTRWAIRTMGDPAKYAATVRAEMAKLDRGLLLTDVLPMQTYVTRSSSATRFSLLLIGAFAGFAVSLAAVGLYGVLSTVVRQRTAEIGVRVAVGASPAGIYRLLMGHGLRLTAGGLAVGLLAAIALTRVMTSMLVGVAPTDPVTFISMVVLFFLIAGAATWLPARRAAALDPSQALREG